MENENENQQENQQENQPKIQLDNQWIEEFEKTDKGYEIFYKEDVQYIRIHCIYIDSTDSIQKITEEKVFVNNSNTISRDEILGLLKKNSVTEKRKYNISSILKYNIDLEPVEITDFLKKDYNFLSVIKNIDTIPLNQTINMFQDLNTLFIIFYEKEENKQSKMSQTRKIYLQSHKKTQRKPLKMKE